MRRPVSVAYIIDPRLPGGTSSAVAQELAAIADIAQVKVHALESQMFRGRNVAPQLARRLDDLRLELVWDSGTVSADIVILHNPSFLKFQHELGLRIFARHLVVVTHENFLRPGRHEGFGVLRCLDQIDRSSLALRKSIAPVSSHNRSTVRDWLSLHRLPGNWAVLDRDWFNVCDFPRRAPATAISDRRGRHSRPGLEKFPGLGDMDLCFPKHAEANVILGADLFLALGTQRPHWLMFPFQGIDLERYFEMFDFMVYFTSPMWRESFGRVLAEAVAAGKVVISDAETAATFGGAVIQGTPATVDSIIQRFIDQPRLYRDHVLAAQGKLDRFSAAAFREHFLEILSPMTGAMA